MGPVCMGLVPLHRNLALNAVFQPGRNDSAAQAAAIRFRGSKKG